jgi:hypothetical protein
MRMPDVKSSRTNKLRRLHNSITRDIGMDITSGLYDPGDVFSGEVSSSRSLEVSRSTYRETIRSATIVTTMIYKQRPRLLRFYDGPMGPTGYTASDLSTLGVPFA